MAKDINKSVSELVKDESVRKQLLIDKYISKEVGLPTLNDIMNELSKPGLDQGNSKSFGVFC